MFGLMRAKKCGMSDEERHFRRLNYCGTCKTIGSLYGQKARFLLNHDTVFLAEILTALSGEKVSERSKAYQSFNCLSLPDGEMPTALEFAATVNVILTEFKLADHVEDENRRTHRVLQKTFSNEFQKAEKLLNEWKFPLSEIKEILQTQTSIEKRAEYLDELAFPTAQTTAVFFREGVRRIGHAELATIAFEIGFEFGKLIYLIDAFEDYEKDLRRGRFNAFRTSFNLHEAKLTGETKRRAIAVLRGIEHRLIAKFDELPLPESKKTLFIARLSENLNKKLKEKTLPVLPNKKVCTPKPRRTFAQKLQDARTQAQSLTRGVSWQMPLVFVFVFAVALLAPAQTREAKSARECFDLSFNLMFIGAVFAAPLQMVAIGTKKRKRKKSDWCDCDCCCCGFDCDCCECDCCCDFEGFDCCSCDSCDCCQCSCD